MHRDILHVSSAKFRGGLNGQLPVAVNFMGRQHFNIVLLNEVVSFHVFNSK